MKKAGITFFFLVCCTIAFAKENLNGLWRGELKLNDSISLPFHFEIQNDSFKIINQSDDLRSNEIIRTNDSIIIQLAVFGTELHFGIEQQELNGYFINTTKLIPTYVPCRATKNTYRFFDRPEVASVNFTGRYDVYFKNEDEESSHAVAIFKQEGNYITGTFLTTTGDFRFLEGDVSGKKMFASAFDGSHLFYFSAEMKGDSIINGTYYSSISWFDEWRGKKNANAALSSAETYIQYDSLPMHFTFYNADGKAISLDDSTYCFKPVIIQLMGSWCPNCMDETKFLSKWYAGKNSEVEVIALDFERLTDTLKINHAMNRIKKYFNVQYPILYAGSSDKSKAVKSFPQLNRILAFPTLIFLNRDKRIIATHSGFSGPATGEEYEKFQKWFYKIIDKLSH